LKSTDIFFTSSLRFCVLFFHRKKTSCSSTARSSATKFCCYRRRVFTGFYASTCIILLVLKLPKEVFQHGTHDSAM